MKNLNVNLIVFKIDPLRLFFILFLLIFLYVIGPDFIYFLKHGNQNSFDNSMHDEAVTNTANGIQKYTLEYGKLPENLAVLDSSDLGQVYTRLEQREYAKNIDYSILGKYQYKLCYDFPFEIKDGEGKTGYYEYYIETANIYTIYHPQGYFCYEFDIEKNTYKLIAQQEEFANMKIANMQSKLKKIEQEGKLVKIGSSSAYVISHPEDIEFERFIGNDQYGKLSILNGGIDWSKKSGDPNFAHKSVGYEVLFLNPVTIREIAVLFSNCMSDYCGKLTISGMYGDEANIHPDNTFSEYIEVKPETEIVLNFFIDRVKFIHIDYNFKTYKNLGNQPFIKWDYIKFDIE